MAGNTRKTICRPGSARTRWGSLHCTALLRPPSWTSREGQGGRGKGERDTGEMGRGEGWKGRGKMN